jgi:hypothetical protein
VPVQRVVIGRGGHEKRVLDAKEKSQSSF